MQKWKPDAPSDLDGSLESMSMNSNGKHWDQFAENERRFGVKTDYDESIYTTVIDKTRPDYKQRLMYADKKAREIERSTTNNAHVAEERIQNHIGGNDNGGDEEDKCVHNSVAWATLLTLQSDIALSAGNNSKISLL